KNITGTFGLQELVNAVRLPRRIILMVKAGKPLDEFIDQLAPLLAPGDILVDGGNSHFQDTERREKKLREQNILYIGTGVSGGEEGALRGPSIMPGGSPEAYAALAPVLAAIAARVHDEPCCAYIGPGGAGHFVKMVHNGIEYGIMQLIAETYDFLSRGPGLAADRIADIIEDWNSGDLNSYLLEITGIILRRKDPKSGVSLVELILDTAAQKGTGKWTSQSAFDLGVPVPTINAAVEARILSALKSERTVAATLLPGPQNRLREEDWIQVTRDALQASIITSYAQGLALIQAGSTEYNYGIRLEEVAKLWRGGCIIRAAMLEPIREALHQESGLVNLMTVRPFSDELARCQPNLRKYVATAADLGLPCMAMSASLGYYDSYRQPRLPANLIQAQRDFFGAHTYHRTDREGTFHTQWTDGDDPR
ncbi:NADP-dependent phosphogluconate dehydrogenase, partial [Candidatus Neomarinimicrobiota bacterium]